MPCFYLGTVRARTYCVDIALPVGGSEDQCMEVESVGLPPEVAWKLFWIGWLHSSEVDDWRGVPYG